MDAVESHSSEKIEQSPNESRKEGPSKFMLAALLVAITLVDLPISIYEIYVLSGEFGHHVSYRLSAFHAALKVLASIALIHIVIINFCFNISASLRWRRTLKTIFCISFTAGSIVRLFNKPMNDHHQQSFLSWYQGNTDTQSTNADYPQITFTTLSVMFCPLLFGVIFYTSIKQVIWGIWVLCLSSLVAHAIWMQSAQTGFTVIYYFILSGVIFCGIDKNDKEVIVLVKEKEIEKEKVINAFDQNMKSMVGNVAHDLKTVSSTIPY